MSNYQLIKNTEWKEVEINGEMKNIPIDWSIDALKNLCDVRDGTHESPKFLENGIPFVTTKNLINGKIDFTSAKFISKENHEDFSRRSKVDNGDILLGMIGTVGNPIMVKNKTFDFSIKNLGLIKTKNKINQNFLFFEFNQTIEEQKQKSDGGVLKFMTLGVLRGIQIYYPSENEQSAIASILSEQESVIENIEQLIEKYEQRFQYLSDELFSGKLRVKEVNGEVVLYKNPDYNWQEVEINGEMKEIPSDWYVSKLKSLVKKSITKGTTPTTIGFSFLDKGEVKFFKVEHLKEDKLLPTNIFINNNCNEKMKRSQLAENDLLFSIAGTIGNVAKVNKTDLPANINQAIAIIRFKDIEDLDYTKFYIKNYVEKITQNTLTGVIPNFNLEMLENIEVPYPNINKSVIASILFEQELLISEQKKLLVQENHKFNWLLDNLLSGKYLIKE